MVKRWIRIRFIWSIGFRLNIIVRVNRSMGLGLSVYPRPATNYRNTRRIRYGGPPRIRHNTTRRGNTRVPVPTTNVVVQPPRKASGQYDALPPYGNNSKNGKKNNINKVDTNNTRRRGNTHVPVPITNVVVQPPRKNNIKVDAYALQMATNALRRPVKYASNKYRTPVSNIPLVNDTKYNVYEVERGEEDY